MRTFDPFVQGQLVTDRANTVESGEVPFRSIDIETDVVDASSSAIGTAWSA